MADDDAAAAARRAERLKRARLLVQQGRFDTAAPSQSSQSQGRSGSRGRGDENRGRGRGRSGSRGPVAAERGRVEAPRKVWQPKSARNLAVPTQQPVPQEESAVAGDDNVERPRLALERASDYEVIGELGKGQFGVVTEARRRPKRKRENDAKVVAMKHLRFDFYMDGFPLEALREITLLSSVRHPNIVTMHAVAYGDGDAPKDWYLVMEPAGRELSVLIRGARQRPLAEAQVKHLMLQLFRALAALHSVFVMHRDLKTPNVLVDDRGVLRLCDFGLARRVCCGPELFEYEARGERFAGMHLYEPQKEKNGVEVAVDKKKDDDASFPAAAAAADGDKMSSTEEEMVTTHQSSQSHRVYTTHTPNVISGHYRPPEVLLGCRDYGRSVDVWSAGCIFGELLSRQVVFAGKDEPDQLRQIFSLVGEPTADEWPLYPHLARARGFKFETSSMPELQRRALRMGGTELLRRRFPAQGFDGDHGPLNAMTLVSPMGHLTTSLANTGFSLLARTLTTCPENRVTALDAKRDRWFSTKPVPEPLTPDVMNPLFQLARIAEVSGGEVPQFSATGFSNQPLPQMLMLAQAAAIGNVTNPFLASGLASLPGGGPTAASGGGIPGLPTVNVANALAIARARALALANPPNR